MNNHDVIIIGAGVAGATAAYYLAKAGKDILVIEKEKLPRHKTCGGGVVYRAKQSLPFNIDEVVERNFKKINVYDYENDLCFKVNRKKPVINLVMRSNLDNLIISEAAKFGAKIYDGLTATNLINNDEYLEVTANNSTFKSGFVIAADGASGVSLKVLGYEQKFFRAPAVECEVYLSENEFERYKNIIRFDFGYIPHGYGWVFPKNNHLSVGIALMKKAKLNLNFFLKNYLEMLGYENVINMKKHGFLIPINPFSFKPFLGRILLTGDTIGLADPITAEGISYAIESGRMAAEAIIDGVNDQNLVNKCYKEKLKPLFKELKYARILARFVYGSPKVRRFVFKHYGKCLSELLTDVIMKKNRYSSIMKNPINYIKLLDL